MTHMETNLAASAPGLVIAAKEVLAEAQDIFSQIGAKVETASLEAIRTRAGWKGRSAKSYGFIAVYVKDQLPHQLSDLLRNIKQVRNVHLLCYVAHHEMDLAFSIGMTVGRELGQAAEIASNVRRAKQLLKSWHAVLSNQSPARKGSELIDVRARLDLTQDEMASALNVTTRTLQNWERDIGTSQMERKTKDLWELLELMDDYVAAREEKKWLNTPNAAFKKRKPVELIVEGKLRDLIVEFHRLREGQPL